jgi:ABC-type branched-subunit amino acid transport system substrate-binding protein
MKNITLQISEEELREVTQAYKTLQNFLEKIISPNELYTDEFLDGLQQAQDEVNDKNFVEVKDFADFIQ